MSLDRFLAKKPLYYDHIDLERMPKAYAFVATFVEFPKFVHVVGTNGKGSTGRMLATLLHGAGYSVGHYTSPHILRFNERIWVDGEEASDQRLEIAHETLMACLPRSIAEELSYFEYTTLLALVVMKKCDYVVLEAGLGGELDATNVVSKLLSIVTPIGLDHQQFLGKTIESVATTKLRSIQKRVLLARQYDDKVYTIAQRVAEEKGAVSYWTQERIKSEVQRRIEAVGQRLRWPFFLKENAQTAAVAYELLTQRDPPIERLEHFNLRGRFEWLNDKILLDVGHNLLGAKAIVQALAPQRRHLIYNGLSDKDVEGVLYTLKPVVRSLQIIDINSERAIDRGELEAVARKLGYDIQTFKEIEPDEPYLVFGSFHVAEAFLKHFEKVYR